MSIKTDQLLGMYKPPQFVKCKYIFLTIVVLLVVS